jgi:hypothetical protein
MRQLITPGYRAHNGHIFSKADCEDYNRVQSRINSFTKAGMMVPQFLLNQSHLVFNIITKAVK